MNIIQKKYILVRDELAVLRQLLYSIFNPKDLIFSSFWFIIPHRCFVNDFLKTKTEIWYYSLIATLDVKVWTFGSSSFVCFFWWVFFFGISNQIAQWFGWEPIFYTVCITWHVSNDVHCWGTGGVAYVNNA